MSSGNNKQTIYLLGGCNTLVNTPYVIGKQWSGGNDPKKKVPQGYTMNRVYIHAGRILYRQKAVDPPGVYRSGTVKECFGGVGVTWNTPANATQMLLNKLASKVRGHDFNLGVSGAEMNESLGMIGSRSKQIAQSAHNLADSFKKFIPAAAWLEAVYGWLPLLSDIDEGAKAIASNLNKPRQQVFRARMKFPGTPVAGSPANFSPAGVAFEELRGMVIMKEKQSLVANLQLDDPLSIMWEKLPYSFVADWFLPIGGYLNARAFLAGTEADYVISRLTTYRLRVGKWKDTYYECRGFESYASANTTFTRTVGKPTLPLPRARPLKDVFSNWRHCIDGLFLADQKLRHGAGRVR